MTMKDRIRAAVEARTNKPAEPPPSAPQIETPVPAPKGKKPPKPPGETVKYLCGHPEGLANLRGRLCPACQRAHQRRRNAARRERKEGQAQARETQRLPDGARFDVAFDATAVLWRGTLTVNGVVFTSEASGVTRLLYQLDDLYRESLKVGC